MQSDYPNEYRKWDSVRELNTLFALPIVKFVPENMQNIDLTLRWDLAIHSD